MSACVACQLDIISSNASFRGPFIFVGFRRRWEWGSPSLHLCWPWVGHVWPSSCCRCLDWLSPLDQDFHYPPLVLCFAEKMSVTKWPTLPNMLHVSSLKGQGSLPKLGSCPQCFSMPVCISYHLLDIGEYQDSWWLSLMKIRLIVDVDWRIVVGIRPSRVTME